ncbi:MAG: hypothetical protein ACXVYY_03860 [Oryzihumus sp.]|uniref:Uncharacterized protein n=1 Tax=Oryzihumus leptocrescens TaxID=297536 RepID=A0A542ZJP6_9MICO|nr:hypothetical protein [Oryzihumus leptocrescens]TQL60563.1 hypothetical protein FB474_1958 [Oryzihumus leptocrescens]
MIVDCDTCPVRGSQCADCVVTALTAPLSADMPLDRQEQRAVSALVAAGLVRADRVAGLRARREPWTGARAAV